MDLPVPDSRFRRQKLALRTASLLSSSRLLVDDLPAERSGSNYALIDDDGNAVRARLLTHPVDPIPRVEVGDKIHQLVPPLRWWEYVWMALPIALTFIGGTVGAFLGFSAAYVNTRVFRLPYPKAVSYLLTGVVTLAASAMLAVASLALGALLG